jgi:hypothetical protein
MTVIGIHIPQNPKVAPFVTVCGVDQSLLDLISQPTYVSNAIVHSRFSTETSNNTRDNTTIKNGTKGFTNSQTYRNILYAPSQTVAIVALPKDSL